jgi:transcriptional regulator with XRE-family HTH domain
MSGITDEAIGALVREQRRKKGNSQTELGQAAGVDVSEQMVQKYETGQSSLTVIKLAAIAEFLGCNIRKLIPREPE